MQAILKKLNSWLLSYSAVVYNLPFLSFARPLLLSFLIFYAGTSSAQKQITTKFLSKQIKRFSKNPLLHQASISFCLTDLATGKMISSFDAQRALVPASIQKLITCSLLLNEVSENYQYSTPFYFSGNIEPNNIFDGNLEISGSGDPSFASPYLDNAINVSDLADTLAKMFSVNGIQTFTGTIKVDPGIIKDIPENKEWLWYDLGNYYGAGCYGFNFFENQATIKLAAAEDEGGICRLIMVYPEMLSKLYISNVIGTQMPIETDVYVLGNSQSCTQEIRGYWKCCKNDTITIRSAINNPSQIFIQALKDSLSARGIIFQNTIQTPPSSKKMFFEYKSPTMDQLVSRALLKSVNLYCESFLHLLGNLWNGTTDRQKAIDALIKNVGDKINKSPDFVFEDGSGLSPKNMISSLRMCQILNWIHQQKKLQRFWTMLPHSTIEGPLAPYLRLSKYAHMDLYLKTGSMERIKSYAGYITKNNKPKYALSLIINHYTCPGDSINKIAGNFINTILNSKL